MKRTAKRWAALALALSMAASFAGCSKEPVKGESSSSLAESSGVSSKSSVSADDYDYSGGLTAEGYYEGVRALDYVTLPDYREMAAPASVTDITDNALQQEIDSILAGYAGEDGTPELTDEFVAKNLKESRGWSTVGEMKAGVRQDLLEEGVRDYLWQQIQELSKVKEIPETVSRYYANTMKKYYIVLAEQSNQELEDFLNQQFNVSTLDELEENNRESLEGNAKTGLILQALCEDMGIHPTEEEVSAYYVEKIGQEGYDEYQERYGKPYLYLMFREDKAKQRLGKEDEPQEDTESQAESGVSSAAEEASSGVESQTAGGASSSPASEEGAE